MSHRGMRLTFYDASDIQVGLCEKRLYQIPLINHLYPLFLDKLIYLNVCVTVMYRKYHFQRIRWPSEPTYILQTQGLQSRPGALDNLGFTNPCQPISGVILVCLGKFQTLKKGFRTSSGGPYPWSKLRVHMGKSRTGCTRTCWRPKLFEVECHAFNIQENSKD